VFFTANIRNALHSVVPGDFSWVVKDRLVEACLICALSNMFMIMTVLQKE